MFSKVALGTAVLIVSIGANSSLAEEPKADLNNVKHIIVIYMENRSFDNLFGFFPNADGIASAGATKIQVDKNGRPYDFLPPAMEEIDHTGQFHVDLRFPDNLPNQPFNIDAYVPINEKTGDPIHRFYHQQAQIDGGLMDKFATYSNMGALVMGYYDGSKTKLWKYAQHYMLADHFFHAAFGGSFLNHFWLICACTPRYENVPNTLRVADDLTAPLRGLPDQITPDGFAVNTLQPAFEPHNAKEPMLPPQVMTTIGDELTAKRVKWAWYAGGWAKAVKGENVKHFQYHHQPFIYFDKYKPDTDGYKNLRDEDELTDAIKKGTEVPEVVFYKPVGDENEHPGYANIFDGDKHIGELLCNIEKSAIWSESIVIVTFDENGGYWDHVPPPKVDRWGPGVRVPTVIISPFAKKGFIDHTVYDTTAILKLIETRHGLKPLGSRDENSQDLRAALDFSDVNIKNDNRVCRPDDKPKSEAEPQTEPGPKP